MPDSGSSSRSPRGSSRAWRAASALPGRASGANRAFAMEYISTRGSAPALDFEGVTLAGLASDGGLYLPREWPRFSEHEIVAMAGLPYAELAPRIMAPFVAGSLTDEELPALCRDAYGRFSPVAVTPLVHPNRRQRHRDVFHGHTPPS